MKHYLGIAYRFAALVVFKVAGLPMLYLLEPFVRVRMRDLFQDRIGHLSSMNEVMARRWYRDGKPQKSKYIFFSSSYPSNQFLLKMWKRKLYIIENRWLNSAYYGFQPALKKTRFYAGVPIVETAHDLLSEMPPVLKFTEAEESEGQRNLRLMGVGENDWFMCFHARDASYLTSRPGFNSHGLKDPYRNCSIENYMASAEWVAVNGGVAIRVGFLVDAPLQENAHPRIIDYSTKHRSDFMDVYLSAKCKFFLGNSSGLICVPVCFNRYTAQANKVPLTASGLGNKQLFTPKLLYSLELGRILTFPEMHSMGLFDTSTTEKWRERERAEFYVSLGLKWIENTSEDVLDLTKDMMDMVDGNRPPSRAVELQERYRYFHSEHLSGPQSSRIGPRFALKYSHLIENKL